MSENPQKVIIDVGGTALHTANQALNFTATIILLIATVVVLFIGFALSTAVALGIVALIGAAITISYSNFPKLTSLFLIIPSVIFVPSFFRIGEVPHGVVFSFVALYGILIFPPWGIDIYNLKIKRDKLYSIGIRAFVQLFFAGLMIGLGYVIASDPSLNDPEGGDSRAFSIAFFALGGFAAYYGCINAKRQKDYLVDPEATIEQWKADEYWKNLKFSIKKNPTKMIKKLYNEEAIKRGKKPIPMKKSSPYKSYLSPGQIERRRKISIAKDVVKQLIKFGPEGG